MVTEYLTDDERQILRVAVLNRLRHAEPDEYNKLASLLSRISGTDTTLIARRAYPSRCGEDC